jgi:predicted esterase
MDMTQLIDRRAFLAQSAGALFGASALRVVTRQDFSAARIKARPHKPRELSGATGTIPLLNGAEHAFVVVPPDYSPDHPAPLVVALHGAGQRASEPQRQLGDAMREAGILLLCVDSSDMTWDAIRGTYGDDVAMIDRAMSLVFDKYSVDPKRVVLAGFSDGASYTLGLGLLNSKLFTKLVAFSPGFITRTRADGAQPPVFISHGRQDRILPFDNDRDSIVPDMQRYGCKVEFHAFEGGHQVPPDIARLAAQFISGR